MIVPVMAISNLVLTQQIYSEETNGAHAHYREPVPLKNSAIGNRLLFSELANNEFTCPENSNWCLLLTW